MAFNAKRAVALAMAFLAALLVASATVAHAGPYDPAYHIFTPGHWINDPNGPYRDPVTGRIHLYMQYNPYDVVWGNISWYHVTSTDYAKWHHTHPNISIHNDRWYDSWGVYSGTMMNNNYSEPVAIYTCTEEVNIQRQCIANPIKSDLAGKRLLNTFEKSPLNPIMTEDDIPGLVGLDNFRDPTEWWPDPAHPGRWLIAFVARIRDEEGDNAHVVIFSTEDPTFQSGYKFSHSLYVYKYDLDTMFECPDFFTVDATNEYFLKVSTMPSHRDYMVYGSYQMDAAKDQYVFVEDPARSFTFVDYGPYYAAKTFYDPILKRRMIWGWTTEELSPEQVVAVGYSGVQSIRDIVYDTAEQQLKFPPLAEMKGLRTAKLFENRAITLNSSHSSLVLVDSSADATKHQEVVARFQVPSEWFESSRHFASAPPKFGLKVRMSSGGDRFVAVSVQMPETNATVTRAYSQVEHPFKIYDLPLNGTSVETCRRSCEETRVCVAWALKYKTQAEQCTLYWKSAPLVDSIGVVSGRPNVPLLYVNRTESGTIGYNYSLHGRAPLSTRNPNIVELRVFVDNSVIEVFKDDGLQVLTSRIYIPDQQNGDIFSGVAVFMENMPDAEVKANVTVYAMSTMWATDPPRPNVYRKYTDDLGQLISLTHDRG